jgi:hypothetical protein
VLAGLVERVTYHNAENGFCVVRARARGHRDVVTVVGHAYYFYIRDEVLGPMVMRVASFLPFQTTYYLNGHSFIEQELTRAQVPRTDIAGRKLRPSMWAPQRPERHAGLGQHGSR